MRRAFTLIELLIVIAVIGLLLAIAVPVLMMVRETSNRTQCQSNLRQIGTAIYSYSATHDCLPIGRVTRFPDVDIFYKSLEHGDFEQVNTPDKSTQEVSWAVALGGYVDEGAKHLPYSAEDGIFGYIDSNPPFYLSGLNRNYAYLRFLPSLWRCPSDYERSFLGSPGQLFGQTTTGEKVNLPRGNYAASWGNTNWQQSEDLNGDGSPEASVKFAKAAFGVDRVRLGDFFDGTGRTILISEIIQGQGRDVRGLLCYPMPGASLYMSRLTPNGDSDVYRFNSGGDAIPFGVFCTTERLLPCSPAFSPGTSFAGSRSRHSGGVNSLMADGSVQFISNDVDSILWLAANSIASGDG